MGLVQRQKLFVDPQVQGTLLCRVGLYWSICVGLIMAILACLQFASGSATTLPDVFRQLWFQYSPALVVSFLVLPLVLLDVVRISNRFVGPMYRLRHSMRRLARGERVAPIKFRDGDFWLEFAEEFNKISELVNAGSGATTPGTADQVEQDLADALAP